MHGVRIGMVIVFLVATICVASALSESDITITSNPPWVVAGNPGTTQLWVTVLNASCSGGGCTNITVTATVENTSFGSITPSYRSTGSNGTITMPFIFIPKTVSGNANITITAIPDSSLMPPGIKIYSQKIDHNIPVAYQSIDFTQTVPVASQTEILVRLRDTYGNSVDSRREDDEGRSANAESMTFSDSPEGDGGFCSGDCTMVYVDTYPTTVNRTGYFKATYHVPSIAGMNVIKLRAPSSLAHRDMYITIRGIGTIPDTITSVVNPANHITYADGYSTVSLLYTIKDSFNNPVPYYNFWQNTSLGESKRFTTNDEGQVLSIYGPKGNSEIVAILATPESYPAVNTTDIIQFVETGAVMWEITANPLLLASRDVKPDSTADIRAKITDVLGNPVPNETVSFTILSVTNTTPLIAWPSLGSISATTDADGFATITLQPGEFPGLNETGYDPYASGTATVQAQWNGKTKSIVITYKNYAFLRLKTVVNPQTVGVNETFDVTIQLIADGWSMRRPIDVVLCTDRSGSMSLDEPDDRIIPVMAASKQFAQEMDISSSQDHVGLVSFGRIGWANLTPVRRGSSWDWSGVWTNWDDVGRDNEPECYVGGRACGPSSGLYSLSSNHQQYVSTHYPGDHYYYPNSATLDVPLNWDMIAINASIDAMVPTGWTPMRYALYTAINEIDAHGRSSPSTIRAIVLLSDGDYNWYGDPLARGHGDSTCTPSSYSDLASSYCTFSGLGTGQYSNQNMSIYAKSKNIVIYSIGYADSISSGGRNTLRILAESTGGKYYDGDAANIADIYRSIADDLTAGAVQDTTMNLNFQNINVSYINKTSSTPGRDVLEYQYMDGYSSALNSWNTTPENPLPGHIPPYPYTIDQTDEWAMDPPQLNFYPGNLSVGQIWQATFTFGAKQPGDINIFGVGSKVCFNQSNINYCLTFPPTLVSAASNLTTLVENQSVLDVKNLVSESDASSQLLNSTWTLYYMGNNSVKQEVFYQFSQDNISWSGNWIRFSINITESGNITDVTYSAMLDIRGITGYYRIKVIAKERITGGAYDEEEYGPIHIIAPKGVIKIE